MLDADAIKGMLPEYQGWNAAQVHEESGHIFDRITQDAVNLGLNIVHDVTMKTPAKAVALVKQFKDKGYQIAAHYMHLPRAEAARRAVQRFLGPTGRFVPPDVILANTQNERAFDEVKGLADRWSFRDNQSHGKEATGPRLIAESPNQDGGGSARDGAGNDGPHGRDGRAPELRSDAGAAVGLRAGASRQAAAGGLTKGAPPRRSR